MKTGIAIRSQVAAMADYRTPDSLAANSKYHCINYTSYIYAVVLKPNWKGYPQLFSLFIQSGEINSASLYIRVEPGYSLAQWRHNSVA
jgi:hypothetical protein